MVRSDAETSVIRNSMVTIGGSRRSEVQVTMASRRDGRRSSASGNIVANMARVDRRTVAPGNVEFINSGGWVWQAILVAYGMIARARAMRVVSRHSFLLNRWVFFLQVSFER
jgi:hypothetical protein